MTNIEKITEVLKECYKTEVFKDSEESILQTATALHNAGYRKQRETVEEFIKDVKNIYAGRNDKEKHTMIAFLFKQLEKLAEQYGKEEK